MPVFLPTASLPSGLIGRRGHVPRSPRTLLCRLTPPTCFFNQRFSSWLTWAFIPNKVAKNIVSIEAF